MVIPYNDHAMHRNIKRRQKYENSCNSRDGLENPVEFLLSRGNDHDSAHDVDLVSKIDISESNILQGSMIPNSGFAIGGYIRRIILLNALPKSLSGFAGLQLAMISRIRLFLLCLPCFRLCFVDLAQIILFFRQRHDIKAPLPKSF